MTSRDVIVIGGGAAGSTAAFHLAKNGHKVTVLEKETTHQIKACGGGMAASVQDVFPFSLNPVIEEVINKVEFSWCLTDPVVADLPGSAPFWIVRRENLDDFILAQAINTGAEVIRPFKVENIQRKNSLWEVSSANGQSLDAKSIIIADGSKSPWPKRFKLGPRNHHIATTTSVRLQGRGNLPKGTAKFEFGLVHHGFAWAFPLGDEVNIGVGSFIGKSNPNINLILSKLLPFLGFDEEAGFRQQIPLRVWNGHSPIHSDGILAVGDAASLCDPFLAEGLRPALISGLEASRCLDKWLKGESNNLTEYSKIMKHRWGESMAWGKRISQVFYRFPKLGYELGVKRPTAPKRIAQILSGEMGYGDIAQRVIRRLLFQN